MKLINDTTQEIISEATFRAIHPYTCFPSLLTNQNITGFGWSIYVEPPQPAPVPTSVTMRQARLQLLVMGVYSTVNSAVATMSDAAQIEWEYAVTVDRDNTLTQQMIAMLGWTEQQADDYFTAASLL